MNGWGAWGGSWLWGLALVAITITVHAGGIVLILRLLESVRLVLLDTRAIDRGVFQEATIRQLIDDTGTGKADHAYLLQVLLIVELWQRENL